MQQQCSAVCLPRLFDASSGVKRPAGRVSDSNNPIIHISQSMEKKRYSCWPLDPAIDNETHAVTAEPALAAALSVEPCEAPAPVVRSPAPVGRSTRLMALEEVADFLGVSTRWIYDNHARLGIPALRIGRTLRFRPTEINAWLDTRSTTQLNGIAAAAPGGH